MTRPPSADGASAGIGDFRREQARIGIAGRRPSRTSRWRSSPIRLPGGAASTRPQVGQRRDDGRQPRHCAACSMSSARSQRPAAAASDNCRRTATSEPEVQGPDGRGPQYRPHHGHYRNPGRSSVAKTQPLVGKREISPDMMPAPSGIITCLMPTQNSGAPGRNRPERDKPPMVSPTILADDRRDQIPS